MKSILMMILCCSFSCLSALAAKFDVRQLAGLVDVSDPQISPDGKSIVIVVSRPDYELDLYRSELVLVDIATHKKRVLTHERKGVGYRDGRLLVTASLSLLMMPTTSHKYL